MSTIAALALLRPPEDDRTASAHLLLDMSPGSLALNIRGLWRWFAGERPDLLNRAWPLAEIWLGEQDLTEDQLRAAKKTADAAIRGDLFSLTGTDRREDTDLLGMVLTALRPKSALQGRGQFYSPSTLSTMMGTMLDPAEHEHINEPAAGTGGMLRGAAEAMRRAGREPARARWVASDIDPDAVACLAVNVVLWGLGTNVLLGCGDTLAYDFMDRAEHERIEPVLAMRELLFAKLLGITLSTDSLIHAVLLAKDAHNQPRNADRETLEAASQ
ncbi:hypothetical protein BC739_006737 [Kutzneria viridogrisea]|uniref:DNA methylase adenine-specific domain-containing protein n=1 Tax=Kutzneria viridogrisea TaxID=47990 RepID=A0ABR6BRI0_9PSEU|nr:hypothetical protein [Kutzneria viridogrisea]